MVAGEKVVVVGRSLALARARTAPNATSVAITCDAMTLVGCVGSRQGEERQGGAARHLKKPCACVPLRGSSGE